MKVNHINHARNKFNQILNEIKEYSKIIQSIVLDSLIHYFKSYFNFLDNKNIESTSNKLENFFKRTLPESVKKLMKYKKGLKSRITLRIEI